MITYFSSIVVPRSHLEGNTILALIFGIMWLCHKQFTVYMVYELSLHILNVCSETKACGQNLSSNIMVMFSRL